MTLLNTRTDTEYTISHISAAEEGMKEFLFTLGCYPGEKVTVISRLAENIIINVKNARYSIDADLASAIGIATEPVKACRSRERIA
ncbi:FeoA family protein [Salinispira pacifica]|uniref:Ferrous iron transporter FeoA-like domain-containing protein n=1 Tax=Salinispira pacifica TaxID=1307761 RepID=V5WF30_9SPIO|nr:FeoA family protein [Salinispira pacifica]AHC14413.1 hypothetical protein L21SP2_0995 [Salinispira pacifica]